VDSFSSGVQPQIFYKKDQDKVVYEEGQETYRGYDPAKHQQKPVQFVENGDVRQDNGASLRRRGVSPQTQQAIQQQKHNF